MDSFGTSYGPQGPVPTARQLGRIRAIRRVLKSPDLGALSTALPGLLNASLEATWKKPG